MRLLLLLVLVQVALCVDHNNFRTCDQTSFCVRNREFQKGIWDFSIDTTSIKLAGSTLSATIKEGVQNQEFTLEITLYKNDVVRFKIKEANAKHERYEPAEVLSDLETVDFKGFDSATNTLSFGDDLTLQFDPATLEFTYAAGGEVVLRANKRGLFNFEANIPKPDPPKEVEAEAEGDEAADPEDKSEETVEETPQDVARSSAEDAANLVKTLNLDNAFEESFKTHHDSKPHGPTAVAMDFTFEGYKNIYGLAEHASDLSLKATRNGDEKLSDPFRLYNLDVFEFELDNPMSLYGGVPFVTAHNKKRSIGMFWLNPTETWIDIDKSSGSGIISSVLGTSTPRVQTHWMSEAGVVDVFVMFGPTPKDVLAQYSSVTGLPYLPPLFSIAYHQCRWNYKDEADVEMVDAGFDEHNIPYDVIWLDIEHTDGKRYFTWDSNKFPTPTRMLDLVSAKGRKMVTIVDPHIKKDDNYYVYSNAKALDLFVKNKDGNEYQGFCWPGPSAYLDFTSEKVRTWWSEQFKLENYKGSTLDLYTWNDMNEPSVFDGPEVSMHKDAIHKDGFEHREVHNVWGLFLHKATHDGHIIRSPGQNTRPFVLSRAFYASTQRYGAIWTGDNAGEWSHLESSLPMLLSVSMSGIPFCGADVGGFFGDPEPDLLARWYQAGIWYPFFRAHGHIDTKRREPWLFGETYTDIIRAAVRVRYALLPYWYTLFHASSVDATPVIRPLWFEYPQDENTFNTQYTYLVGSDILVSPVVTKDQTSKQIYFPASSKWFDYDTNLPYRGGQTYTLQTPPEKIVAFQRAGSIIPRKDRPRRSTTQMSNDPYTLIVALDEKQEANGRLYVDDGFTFNHKKGQFIIRDFSVAPKDGKLVLTISAPPGDGKIYNREKIQEIRIIGLEKTIKSISVEEKGKQRSVDFSKDKSLQNMITIRKPDLPISTVDWSLTITF